MRREKIVLVLVFLLMTLVSVFGTQQLFIQASDEIQFLNSLYRSAGIMTPSFIYPVSADTILYYMEKTKLESALNPALLPQLEALISVLEGEELIRINDELAFSAIPILQPEGYFTTQLDLPESSWVKRYRDRNAFVKGTVRFLFTKMVFAQFEVEFGPRLENRYKKQLEFNQIFHVTSTNLTYPHEAYMSVGDKNFNITAGRFKVSSGNGVSGSLSAGDNFTFRDTIKVSINAFPVTYDLVVNRFDPEDNSNSKHKFFGNGNSSPLVTMHKMSASLFNCLNLALYEATLDWTSGSIMDPKFLNPFMILHNLHSYSTGTTNNFFGFELDWAIVPTLSTHFEIIFDQIQFKTEGDTPVPNAYGALANFQGSVPIDSYLLNWHLEGAYTSPSLFLKKDAYSLKYYQTDLIVGNKLWDHSDVDYLCYKYGPNTVLVQSGIEASDYANSRTASLVLLFKGRGDTGLGLSEVSPSNQSVSPNCEDPNKKPEYLFQAEFALSFGLSNDAVVVYTDLALQNYWNYQNNPGIKKFNAQFLLGLKLDPVKFWKK